MRRSAALALLCLLAVVGCSRGGGSSASAAVAAPVTDDNPTWLVGDWEKTFDPDNEPKDVLRFDRDWGVHVLKEDGQESFKGSFSLDGQAVMLSIALPTGKITKLQLTASTDRKKLYFSTGQVGNHTATYERRK